MKIFISFPRTQSFLYLKKEITCQSSENSWEILQTNLTAMIILQNLLLEGNLKNIKYIIDNNYLKSFYFIYSPKNYCYKTKSGYTDCTVKGYPINYLTNLSLNFESIKYTVTENRQNLIKVPQLKFIKDKSEWLIRTEIQNKFYRFIYDKRVINDDFTTSPFGF